MRVLQCIPNLDGGGAERQLAYLLPGLQKLGVEVHLAFVGTGPNLRRITESRVMLHPLKVRNNHDPLLPVRLNQVMRVVKPDLVQTWLRQMDIVAGTVALIRKIPWILSERSSQRAYGPSLKHQLRVWVGSKATAIISNSRFGSQYWDSVLRGSLRRQYVILNGIPLDEIEAANPQSDEVASLVQGDSLVLFSGRFIRERNLSALLKSLLHVLLRRGVVAVLCGQGPLLPEVRAWVREYQLGDRVLLPGYIREGVLWGLMKRASVFVSPSFYEGNPNAVMEAIACGVPLVVSDIPEHRAFLNEENAILVPPLDWRLLSEGIIRILDHPKEGRLRAIAARPIVEVQSVSSMAEKYYSCYKGLLS
jgi:glycosyltransferase involved in cell wall biosynthesis